MPLIPISLIDMLEAPVPLMLGMTREQMKEIEYKNLENRMWVFLDSNETEICTPILQENEQFIYDPHLGNLHDSLKPEYEALLAFRQNKDEKGMEEKCLVLSDRICESLTAIAKLAAVEEKKGVLAEV